MTDIFVIFLVDNYLKKTINSATKSLIPDNANEAIDKILTVVNIFKVNYFIFIVYLKKRYICDRLRIPHALSPQSLSFFFILF